MSMSTRLVQSPISAAQNAQHSVMSAQFVDHTSLVSTSQDLIFEVTMIISGGDLTLRQHWPGEILIDLDEHI